MDDRSVVVLQKSARHQSGSLRFRDSWTSWSRARWAFSSLYPSSDLKVTTPLFIPPLARSNNQPTHVRIEAVDCWRLGRFRNFVKLCARCCRTLTDVDMWVGSRPMVVKEDLISVWFGVCTENVPSLRHPPEHNCKPDSKLQAPLSQVHFGPA